MIRKAGFDPFALNEYPTTDRKPMAETDTHRRLMVALIETLADRYAADDTVYVTGNLLVFYDRGNKRRHVSPDVMVVFGVPKGDRPNYLVWEEKPPAVVIELTSSTTRREDRTKKWRLYQDVIKVPEYFLFDPFGDYLDPRFQGYRLVAGEYRAVKPDAAGRMTSKKLGLLLAPDGEQLRFVDPAAKLLPTREEQIAELKGEVDRLRRALAATRQPPSDVSR